MDNFSYDESIRMTFQAFFYYFIPCFYFSAKRFSKFAYHFQKPVKFSDMKRTLLFLAAFLFAFADSFSQASFNTGAMEVAVNQYGRVRIFGDDETRHLQRASILVGTTSTSVFDYTNDAEEYEPTVLVANPTMSDYEIYGAFDNSYSNLPPDVIVKLNAYGWDNKAFTILKFNVTNHEVNPMTALIGLDIIPELNQEYGYDSVTYNADEQVIRFHRGNHVNLGARLLSESLSSLYSFEWYEDYSVDADYWTWMNTASLQPQYVSNTADGPVTITSQSGLAIEPDASVDVYYALAIGPDEQTMLDNIASAYARYQSWFAAVNELELKVPALGQNHPNPFSNLTTISYTIPEAGFVSLKVTDATGREVAGLVGAEQAAGTYSIDFNADNLANGLYFCTLNVNGQVQTRKMFLSR